MPVIRDRAAAVREAGARLSESSLTERAVWLARSAEELERRAHEASGALAESTGLSAPMVEWAAHTTLDSVRRDALLTLANEALQTRRGTARPIEMLSVILAGNVFTASVRAIFVPLLLGVPVLVKTSSKEYSFPRLLRAALRGIDARLGAAMDLVGFVGGDAEREAALVEQAEAVAVYGSDETIAAIKSRVAEGALIAHGHGVSVAYCGADAQLDHSIESTSSSLSLDICAYDQRGCLSPQIVFVEETPERSPMELARRLAEIDLPRTGAALPRGPLPPSVGAEQAQWRGIAEVEGELITGEDHAISLRAVPPIRWSPGYRNITLAPVSGLDEAFDALLPFAPHLKCVGADGASRVEVEARLEQSAKLAAYACPLGEMQTPALDAPADGQEVWRGLLRD